MTSWNAETRCSRALEENEIVSISTRSRTRDIQISLLPMGCLFGGLRIEFKSYVIAFLSKERFDFCCGQTNASNTCPVIRSLSYFNLRLRLQTWMWLLWSCRFSLSSVKRSQTGATKIDAAWLIWVFERRRTTSQKQQQQQQKKASRTNSIRLEKSGLWVGRWLGGGALSRGSLGHDWRSGLCSLFKSQKQQSRALFGAEPEQSTELVSNILSSVAIHSLSNNTVLVEPSEQPKSYMIDDTLEVGSRSASRYSSPREKLLLVFQNPNSKPAKKY